MKTRQITRFISLFMLLGLLAFMGCQDLADEMVGKNPPDAKTIRITMIAKSATNPVFISAKIGAEKAAEDLSEKYRKIDVQIDWRTPQFEDAQEQAERIFNAVNEGSDAILISCSNDSILTPAINTAVDSGVPVMTFDSDAPNSRRFAFYGPNDVEIGVNVMTELVNIMGTSGKVAILAGNPQAPNIQKRVEGVRKMASQYPDMEIVGTFYHAEQTADAVSKLIAVQKEYPDLNGWAMVGGWPFFDEKLLEKIEPGKVKIVAVDAIPQQLIYLERGYVDVLLGQPTFKWGDFCVRKIVDKLYLNKEVNEVNEMKLIRVWKDNLGGWARQLRAWGYKGIPKKYLTL